MARHYVDYRFLDELCEEIGDEFGKVMIAIRTLDITPVTLKHKVNPGYGKREHVFLCVVADGNNGALLRWRYLCYVAEYEWRNVETGQEVNRRDLPEYLRLLAYSVEQYFKDAGYRVVSAAPADVLKDIHVTDLGDVGLGRTLGVVLERGLEKFGFKIGSEC